MKSTCDCDTVNEDNVRISSDSETAAQTSSENRDPSENKNRSIDTIKEDLLTKNFVQNDGNITTQNIFNIDYLAGNILSIKDENNLTKVEKQYKLYERSECSEFVNKYKKSLHLAYAIAISLFEYVPVSDLQDLSKRLLDRFEDTLDSNGEKDRTYTTPFISLDYILSIIGAKTCIISYASRFENVTERCVCFDSQQKKIMENLWELFPMLRNEIISWLIEVDCAFKNNNSFSTDCFVRAMVNIIKFDFADSLNRLFPKLVSKPKNRDLLIRLFIILTKDEETKENAYKVLKQWSCSLEWLWEIPLFVYAENIPSCSFERDLKETLRKKILELESLEGKEWNLKLISSKMLSSLKLRSMVSDIFEEEFLGCHDRQRRSSVSFLYLLTIYESYTFLRKINMALPLVAFDDLQQASRIKPIILYIINDFTLRRILLNILEAYINKINCYDIPDSLLKRIKSFFYVLAKDSQRYYNDILRFLSQLQRKNKTAEAIMQFLHDTISPGKDLMLT